MSQQNKTGPGFLCFGNARRSGSNNVHKDARRRSESAKTGQDAECRDVQGCRKARHYERQPDMAGRKLATDECGRLNDSKYLTLKTSPAQVRDRTPISNARIL